VLYIDDDGCVFRHAVSIGRSRLQATRRTLHQLVDDGRRAGDVIVRVTSQSRALMATQLPQPPAINEQLAFLTDRELFVC